MIRTACLGLAAALLLFLLPTAAAADERGDVSLIKTCIKMTETDQQAHMICPGIVVNGCMDMIEGTDPEAAARCHAREMRAWDVIVLERFSELLDQMNEGQQQALRESQEAWTAYRDTSCALTERLATGDGLLWEGPACGARRAAERVFDLNMHLASLMEG